ncbi:tRNA uridine-5-carboxymethylaminomethyl(34) synthesis GTPase MnmE [Peteryoungia desertarenae]|uniref:tRNA modification GTPase MnmE n=1 Tax=Peteryoungia desertarenae TaxID=1813451 RepID=A0ABX6QJW9_9HYPH|nr:tRNA uridine-5-carboxymethylaminomethyl(34) synthesis GTPase MnmE [Peteryoungia desertarenae]QLF68856.1 tRNA uridine-5-carboxymethylaminomethyl(34) synthesis GTPase MnmE [Peteryoungia desertarenae]
MTSASDTIFAMASAGLPAGVAVVRISGTKAFAITSAMVGPLPLARQASLRTIRNHEGQVLDRGLVIAFPAPHSFTGEDCVELQVHGSRAVVRALLDTLAGFPGARLAEAGEFSRRAFENDRMDLVEVEGLADLLAAETEMQRRLALEQTTGHLSSLYKGWREKLIYARALIEAELDFSDEADIPGAVSNRIWVEVQAISEEINEALRQLRAGEIIREGFKVAIIGRPNAGKSSLLNALVSRDVAIVTEYAGTTRDVIRAELDIGGYRIDLFDTAGIRDAIDPVEAEGIRRATQVRDEADLVLYLSEPADSSEPIPLNSAIPCIYVGTKADIADDSWPERIQFDILVSSRTGYGIEALREVILSHVQRATKVNSLAIPSRLRHLQHLKQASMDLSEALYQDHLPLEIRAEYLRAASDSLARVTGRIDVETLLGKIFSEFCVGK